MADVWQAEMPVHYEPVRELFWEYLLWANAMNAQELGIQLDIEALLAEDMNHLQKFLPPYGRLLLAHEGNTIIGCICLKKLLENVGEVKRLYVKPEYRHQGVGKLLIVTLIAEAEEIGYTTL